MIETYLMVLVIFASVQMFFNFVTMVALLSIDASLREKEIEDE